MPVAIGLTCSIIMLQEDSTTMRALNPWMMKIACLGPLLPCLLGAATLSWMHP